MSHRASYSQSDFDTYDDDPVELFAGEPIHVSGARRGSSMLSAMVTLLVLAGCGFALLETKDIWRPWLPNDLSALKSLLTPQAPAPTNHTAVADAALQIGQPLAAREIAEAPSVEAGTPVPSAPALTVAPAETTEAATSETTPGEAAADDKPAAPLPPPVVDASDPYQKRAMAVGLHPDLSRVLLTRMSAADYRNADLAIKKALAETPDGDVFTWPKETRSKSALFEVHFVKSAAHDCRRYVVTITKDRWSTTAQPMEKCGLTPPGRRNS